MLLIGTHLRRLGHDVVLLTAEQHRPLAQEHGLAFEPVQTAGCGHEPPTGALARSTLVPSLVRRYLVGRAEMHSAFIAPLATQHHALSDLLERQQVDVVLADLAFTGALPLVLSDRPRPAVLVCGVGPLTLSSFDTPPFGMAWRPRTGANYERMNRVVRRVLLGGIQSELNAELQTLGGPGTSLPLMDWPRLADRLLQLTVPTFEYPRRDLPRNVDYVGPVPAEPSAGFAPPPWWDRLIESQTVVLVTQGTLDNGDLDQLIGPTLSAFSDRDDVAVVATTGTRTAQTLRTAIPPNAFVTDWVPYSMLMPHVDVMITNGGYGGVQHALRHGVPLIVAGETSDKAEVAARVAYTGVGIDLASARPRPADIRAALRKVMAAGRHRIAAQRLSRDIAGANALDTIAAMVDDKPANSADLGDVTAQRF